MIGPHGLLVGACLILWLGASPNAARAMVTDTGAYVGVAYTLLACVAWVGTYFFRVATKNMTYAVQVSPRMLAVRVHSTAVSVGGEARVPSRRRFPKGEWSRDQTRQSRLPGVSLGESSDSSVDVVEKASWGLLSR